MTDRAEVTKHGVTAVGAGLIVLLAAATRSSSQPSPGSASRPPVHIYVNRTDTVVGFYPESPQVQLGPDSAGTTIEFPDGTVELRTASDALTIQFPKDGGGFVTIPRSRSGVVKVTGASITNATRGHVPR